MGDHPVAGGDGTTLLLTTQYLDEADELADEIVVIDHGLVIAAGHGGGAEDPGGRRRGRVHRAGPRSRRQAVMAVAKSPEGSGGGRGSATRPADRHGQHRCRRPRLGRAGRGGAQLDGAGRRGRGLTLRRPSLDDVFLALTGHAAEEDGRPAAAAQGRPVPEPGPAQEREPPGAGPERKATWKGRHDDRRCREGGAPGSRRSPARWSSGKPSGRSHRHTHHHPAEPAGVHVGYPRTSRSP